MSCKNPVSEMDQTEYLENVLEYCLIRIIVCSRVKRITIILSACAVLFTSPRFFEIEVKQDCTPSSLLGSVTNNTPVFCEPFIGRTGLAEVPITFINFSLFVTFYSLFIKPREGQNSGRSIYLVQIRSEYNYINLKKW